MNTPQIQFGLLKISGKDSFQLLQGQLTCDVKQAIDGNYCLLAAHCNPKGRILWLGHLFHYQDAFYIYLPKTLITTAISSLKKYALFYKVSIDDVSNAFACIGSKELLETLSNLPIFNTQDGRYLYLCDSEPQDELLRMNQHILTDWHSLNMEHGISSIYPQTSEKYLPHELNLHQLGAISFDKGCYTGQEIIARMHYRGKIKKHFIQVTLTCHSQPSPGDDVSKMESDSKGVKICGSFIDVAQLQKTRYRAHIILDQPNEATTRLYFTNHPIQDIQIEKQ